MSNVLANASRLKPEIRLAQAVSQFEADLSPNEKTKFHTHRSQSLNSHPELNDVMRLTATMDRQISRKVSGRCFGPRFTNFLQGVQQFAALGDVVVGGSQNLLACGVWSLVRMSLLSIVNYLSYLEKLSTLFMDIGRLIPRYQTMALLYRQSKSLQSHLSEYFIVVVSLCRYLFNFTKKSLLRQVTSTLNDLDLKTFQTDLERWAILIKDEITLIEAKENSQFRILSSKLSKSAAYQQKLATNLRVLDFCSKYDYETTWKQMRKIGNATLFAQLADYQGWKNYSSSSTLLYTGKLGSGKTVLLANIIDDLNIHTRNNTITVAYFFCRHDIPESLKARTILGSLARQLLRTIPDLDMVADLCGDTSEDPERVLELVYRSFPSGHKAYLVLDGLDECDHAEKEAVIQGLGDMQQKLKLLLLISLRLESNNEWESLTKQLAVTEIALIPEDNPDIEIFIDAELKRCLESRKLVIGDYTLILDIQDALLKGSQGMFLWVALQIQSLCGMKTDLAIREALEDLPKDLSETFSRILHKSGESGNTYQRQILHLITAAYRPLTANELREALSVVPGDTKWTPSRLLNDVHSALACCGCLLTVEEEEKTVHFIHHSVKQFLLNGSNDFEGMGFEREKAQRTMADIIVTYLSYGIFGTELSRATVSPVMIQSAPSSVIRTATGSSSTVQSLALKLLKSRKQPGFDISKTLAETRKPFQSKPVEEFYSYASAYWLHHIPYVSGHEVNMYNLSAKLIERLEVDKNVTANNWTSLIWAAENGNEPIVELLIHSGKVNTNLEDQYRDILLCWAAQTGHGKIVKLLLDKGVDPNAQGGFHGNALQTASKGGHEQVVQLLLDKGAEVNAQGGYYRNALQAASEGGYERVVKLLLDRGAEVNAQGGNHGNALQAASEGGHEPVVKLLLDRGAEVNTQGGNYRNALQAASEGGHEPVVKLLLDRGAEANAQSSGFYGSALQAASKEGHKPVVKLLLDRGAEVNAQGGYSGNALQAASEEGHEPVVKLLLDRGAEVNAQVGYGGSALQAASREGHELVVKLLLDRGAEVNAQGGNYRNALQAASREGHEPVVKLLLDRGAEVNAQSSGFYGSALQAASKEGHKPVVKLLLDRGAEVNAQGGYSGNTLQAASEEGHEPVVKLLLDRGAEVNAQVGYGGNALQAASREGHELVVKLLLDRGAEVNAQSGEFLGNALQAASVRGHELVVKLLLDRGAEVNAQGENYGNALQAASREGHEPVVKLLLDRGAEVNAQGGNYGNALQAASREGHEPVVKLLLDRGAEVNAQGGNYRNALQAASREGHEPVVKLLLDRGAEVNTQSSGFYGSALQAASREGHKLVVKLLLDRGAEVNAQGGYSGNALQAASEGGHEPVVKLLLDRGAEANTQSSGHYGNALQAASSEGYKLVVKLLLDRGAKLPIRDDITYHS